MCNRNISIEALCSETRFPSIELALSVLYLIHQCVLNCFHSIDAFRDLEVESRQKCVCTLFSNPESETGSALQVHVVRSLLREGQQE